MRFGKQYRNAGPAVCGRTVASQMVKERQRVCLSAAELGGEIENGVSLRSLARQTADDLGGQSREILREVCSLEKSFRLLIIGRCPALAHVIEMDGEFGRVERLAFAQVF